MTPTEVAGLLAYLAAAYPTHELPDGAARVWAVELADLHPDDARSAMHAIVRTDTWHPSIQRVRETAGSYARRRHDQAADRRGLPDGAGPALTPTENAARARAARQALRPQEARP